MWSLTLSTGGPRRGSEVGGAGGPRAARPHDVGNYRAQAVIPAVDATTSPILRDSAS